MNIIESFKGSLIVSCQAQIGEPLHGSCYMVKMAQAAFEGGAAGIRAESPEDIRAIKNEIKLPIIGLWKIKSSESEVFITPTIDAAEEVYRAGADMIAVDSTFRKNSEGKWAFEIIREIKNNFDIPILADVSTLEEGINAEEQGADMISTALAGYTLYSRKLDGPDIQLIKGLVSNVKIPVAAEGRIWSIEDAKQALEAGAYTLVIGSAITRPKDITKRFVDAIKNS